MARAPAALMDPNGNRFSSESSARYSLCYKCHSRTRFGTSCLCRTSDIWYILACYVGIEVNYLKNASWNNVVYWVAY